MAARRHSQRGIGTLAVSMILLFATSLVLFHLNRSLIFEQKTSANQVRSTSALEAAEAGLEWATGMLNRPYDISTACVFDTTTNVSFKKRYAQTQFASGSTAISVATNVRPGCTINADNTLTCGCPAVPVSGTAVADLTNTTPLPGFTVSFANVDSESLEVTSVGCSAIAGPCTSATASGSDATATVRVILKLQPTLRSAPAAALTCGTLCALSGSFNVSNTDVLTNGITVNSGTSTTGGNQVQTIAGIPYQNSIVANDATLNTISTADPTCSQDKLFNAYFGTTVAAYAAAPSTKTLTCTSANDCGAQINTAYNDGWRSFYFPAATGFALNMAAPFSQLGTRTDPVTLVTDGQMDINAHVAIYGLLYSDNATNNSLGTGNSDIYGAVLTCARFDSNGNGTVTYDADALRNAQRDTGILVRVPGSWRDF